MVVKQGLLIVIASIAATFFAHQLVLGLTYLVHAHNVIEQPLAGIFSGDRIGLIIQGVVALIVIPIAVGLVLSLGYYMVKKQPMPHVLTVIWVLWAVLLTTLLAQQG